MAVVVAPLMASRSLSGVATSGENFADAPSVKKLHRQPQDMARIPPNEDQIDAPTHKRKEVLTCSAEGRSQENDQQHSDAEGVKQRSFEWTSTESIKCCTK
jgi:hypothetical protein